MGEVLCGVQVSGDGDGSVVSGGDVALTLAVSLRGMASAR